MVMVGHAGGLLWPIGRLFEVPGVRGFFGGGAVGIFFIISGYVVGRSLLRDRAAGDLDPVRFYVRRLIRLGVQVVPLAALIVVVKLIDPTDPNPVRGTVLSALNIVTHTYNQFAATDIFATRSDLGHMWYLSVLQQAYLVIPLLLVAFAGRKKLLNVLLLELIVVSIYWRLHLLETQTWIAATISTVARVDAILIGLLIAINLDWLRQRIPERTAGALALLGLLTMIGLIAILKELPGDYHFLRGWGVAFTLAGAVTVLALIIDRWSPVSQLLSHAGLAWLGRASFVLFVWHLPVFALVERHARTWTWESRTALGIITLGVLTVALNRFVEEPTRRWLAVHLRGRTAPAVDQSQQVMA